MIARAAATRRIHSAAPAAAAADKVTLQLKWVTRCLYHTGLRLAEMVAADCTDLCWFELDGEEAQCAGSEELPERPGLRLEEPVQEQVDDRGGPIEPDRLAGGVAADQRERKVGEGEGGGEFAASLLRAGLVDELISFTAGVVIGADGRAGTGALGLTRLSLAPQFQLADVEEIGGDILHRWVRA